MNGEILLSEKQSLVVAAEGAGAKRIPWIGNTLGELWGVQGAESELSL